MTDRDAGHKDAAVIIVMGVTGSGKTTVGNLLATRIGLPFYDADDFHSDANQQKLADDIPLNDADREPWLAYLVSQIKTWSENGGAVLACSALKHGYRSRFRKAADNVHFVFLHGDPAIIAERLRGRAARGEHVISDFEAILLGQYRDLEVPSDAFRVDINQTPENILDAIVSGLSASFDCNVK